eukprot:6763625-Ditylum_brightwellii.AAC.1
MMKALVTGGDIGTGQSIVMDITHLGTIVVIASCDEDKCKTAALEMDRILATVNPDEISWG